ncbi:MAG: polysaccharide biosynthesis/export family protein [Bacteroidetes bacterium]|nr:polysaccharide biosynthesis/export family protein [Bacteroidota bacterium]
MKQTLTLVIKPALVFLFIAVLLSSCVPQKKIKYLQREQEKDTVSFFHVNKRYSDYKIQVNDNLYIRVYALDEKAFMFFNKQSASNSYNDFANDASIYLNSYDVNSEGYIDFPVVGKVYVKDLNVFQIREVLQKMIGEYLKETTVVVKTVNFKITMVGEVNRPGQFTIYKDDINVFEAISMAGDLSEFANRSKVALVRQSNGGSQVYYLDLNSDKILSSPYYYLQPNDIIYVSPLGYKRWGMGSTFPWALVLGSITTTLLIINYIKTY